MCGICGIVHFDGDPVDRSAIQKGCEALRHRGPDHTGVWVDDASTLSIGLGAVRLAVIDPTPACHQPLGDASGRYHLIFNGELYNYRELRKELRAGGASFQSHGDTEVVLAACARWGSEALTRLEGIWALAFFDAQLRTGFLARDRFGVKPLLYRLSAIELAFGSEMRGLRAMGVFDRAVDVESLVQLLTFGYIADPATIYANVRRLEPGHFLPFGSSGAETPKSYLTQNARHDATDEKIDYADARRRVRHLIDDAVVRQCVSDVPLGAFLSGGLDSSIIVHHMARSSARPIKTFCVGYEGARSFDESEFARLVARRYGTEHHSVVVSEREALATLPRVLDHLGEPVGDSSIVPTSIIASHASRHVTVALSGDGGDELFGGYWRYLGHDALRLYRRIPSLVRHGVIEPITGKLAGARGSKWQNRCRQFRKMLRAGSGDAIERHVAWSTILAPESFGLFTDASRAGRCMADVREEAVRRVSDLYERDPLAAILAFDLGYQLPADMLQKVDLAGMMHSLEVRVPLLDQAVVEAVGGLPSRFKIHKGVRKRLLIDAYRGLLPDRILDRGKQGFEIPIGEYFRGPQRGLFCDVVTRDVVDSFDGVVSWSGTQRLLDEHLSRRDDHADVLFALLSLCWWRRAGG